MVSACSYFVLNAKFLRPMLCCNSTFLLFLSSSVLILLSFLSCFRQYKVQIASFQLKEVVVFFN